MFSVVIPLYNKELSIAATIQSVLAQTFTDFEIVVVNDGSTDGSLQVVEAIEDPRIRIINKPNGGVSSARNRGINEAKYEWVAFLDADDLWMEDHLEIHNKLIKRFSTEKVFCTSFIRNNRDMSFQQDVSVQVIDDYFIEAIKEHFFWTSVVCIHRSVLNDAGLFNENYNRGEDLDLWSRIGRQYRFVRSNKITAIYRLDAENRSDKIKYDINRSFISGLSIKDKTLRETQRKYNRKLLRSSFIKFLKKKDWRNCLFILKKKL